MDWTCGQTNDPDKQKRGGMLAMFSMRMETMERMETTERMETKKTNKEKQLETKRKAREAVDQAKCETGRNNFVNFGV